jgi:putative transposase
MPNPYPTPLRERAVRAYETGTDSYVEVAQRFSIGLATLVRWVQRARDTGTVAPLGRGGGWRSPVDIPILHRLVGEKPDQTTDELTRTYNRTVAPEARVHRSSILRALQRTGYVFKENGAGRPNRIVRASRPSASAPAPGSAR